MTILTGERLDEIPESPAIVALELRDARGLLGDESLESFGRTLIPGETGEFNIYIAVSTSPSAFAAAQTHIDSLRLTMGCSAADGNFIETGTYTLGVEVLGR